MQTAKQLGDTWGEAFGALWLGLVEVNAGAIASAEQRFRQALASGVLGPIMAGPIEGLAQLVADEDPPGAMRLFGAASAIRERLPGRAPARLIRQSERFGAMAAGHLDPVEAEQLWAEGWAMTTDDAVAYALGTDPRGPSEALASEEPPG